MMTAPICPKQEHVHKYHNQEFADSFHWLKDMDPKEKKTEIIDYISLENDYTKKMHVEPNQGLTESIYNEIISRINEDDQDVPAFHKPYFYYKRTVKGLQYPIHCRKRDTLEGMEEVLLDFNQRTEKYIDLGGFKVSPDHKILAYSVDLEGSEKYSIFFKVLETGEILENETITNTSGSINWSSDSKHVWYSVLDDIHRPHKVFRHSLGLKTEDALVYHEKDPKFYAGMSLSMSKEYLFCYSVSSLTSEYSFLKTSEPTSELKLIKKRVAGHRYNVEHQGSRFLIQDNGAKKYLNYRLCSAPIEEPENWQEVIPYNPLIEIEEVVPFKNFIALAERTEGMVKIKIMKAQNGIIDEAAFTHYIGIKQELYSAFINGYAELNYDSSILRYTYSTPISDKKVVEYDMSSKTEKVLKEQTIPGSFDPSKYTLKRIYCPIEKENKVDSIFGTPVPDSVPISLIYRNDMYKGDGSNPCYLYGYGSYGISIDASWSSSKISLIDRGFVFAIAHIRGGGDCGKAWYEVGKFKHKKNTFLDFNACAKYMISEKYTNPTKLAIEGRSAGGLLIGATLNLDPSLYALAVAGVPFVDVINTMMDDTIPLTINEYEEWGNPNEKDYFDYILSYSPYENIPKGKKFPDLLIKAGLFDPRVAYWEPAKYLAKLRDLGMDTGGNPSDPNPSLFVMDCLMSSGHFGSTGRYAYIKEIAADYAFVVSRILKK